MTRVSDEQLELDFGGELEPAEQSLVAPSAEASASIVCFSTHLRSRRAHEERTKDARLLERITNRVQHFK